MWRDGCAQQQPPVNRVEAQYPRGERAVEGSEPGAAGGEGPVVQYPRGEHVVEGGGQGAAGGEEPVVSEVQ
ncbi:hypothetical protein CYMTET_20054 [Cymbomonas tetramitiformis]|uniref:Uncharacterized protein n=1 Tax=Cymbomonas tetramitiformis TaxID=36881 RepID=A0AAE0G4V2_9CHLO|nr:hypothetical protein CYMTET_20054 [Cymbomonas tetramitiformis]